MTDPRTENPRDAGLTVEIVDGVLRISIGVNCLKHAAEHHDSFYLPWTDKWSIVINDPDKFAEEVCGQLEDEQEDGTTPVHRMLDAAIERAVEYGAEGFDYKAMDTLQAAEKVEAEGK